MVLNFSDWLINESLSDKDRVIEISKQYQTRGQFQKYSNKEYFKAYKNGWLDEMTWLINKKYDQNIYSVYVYIDEDNKVAYVGITLDKKRRENEHKKGYKFYGKGSKSSVYNYFTSIGKVVPDPIYLENDLKSYDAQDKEDYWKKKYEENGYTMLNRGATGISRGSLGGIAKKWTKPKVFAESQKYDTQKEFREKAPGAYKAAYKKGWIKEMDWLSHRIMWTKDMVFDESKKYKSRAEFQYGSPSAYDYAYDNKLLDEMIWLSHRKIWNKEKVFDESKKYSSRGEFQDECPSAYDLALKNKWLDEMTWLKAQRKTWDDESVSEESKKYRNKYQFRLGCIGAYKYALRNHMLDDLYPKEVD